MRLTTGILATSLRPTPSPLVVRIDRRDAAENALGGKCSSTSGSGGASSSCSPKGLVPKLHARRVGECQAVCEGDGSGAGCVERGGEVMGLQGEDCLGDLGCYLLDVLLHEGGGLRARGDLTQEVEVEGLVDLRVTAFDVDVDGDVGPHTHGACEGLDGREGLEDAAVDVGALELDAEFLDGATSGMRRTTQDQEREWARACL